MNRSRRLLPFWKILPERTRGGPGRRTANRKRGPGVCSGPRFAQIQKCQMMSPETTTSFDLLGAIPALELPLKATALNEW